MCVICSPGAVRTPTPYAIRVGSAFSVECAIRIVVIGFAGAGAGAGVRMRDLDLSLRAGACGCAHACGYAWA